MTAAAAVFRERKTPEFIRKAQNSAAVQVCACACVCVRVARCRSKQKAVRPEWSPVARDDNAASYCSRRGYRKVSAALSESVSLKQTVPVIFDFSCQSGPDRLEPEPGFMAGSA